MSSAHIILSNYPRKPLNHHPQIIYAEPALVYCRANAEAVSQYYTGIGSVSAGPVSAITRCYPNVVLVLDTVYNVAQSQSKIDYKKEQITTAEFYTRILNCVCISQILKNIECTIRSAIQHSTWLKIAA